MKVIYLVRYALVFLLCLAPMHRAQAGCEFCDNDSQGSVDINVLLNIPVSKAHVGVIPYIKHNGKIYVLLGRERMDDKQGKDAGKFSEFGGKVELNGTTLLHNMARELAEETLGLVEVPQVDLLKKGHLLASKSAKGVGIYYLFYPISDAHFAKSKKFNTIRANWQAQKIKPSLLEKDQFYWFALEDVLKQAPTITDIDGKTHKIKFREYFVRDCLQHAELAAVVARLQ